jgi:flagellar protein FlaG
MVTDMAMDILNRLGVQPGLNGARPSVGKPNPASDTPASDDTAKPDVAKAAAVQSPPVEGARAADNEAKVKGAVKHLNEAVQSIRRELEFSIDDESGRTIVKVLDSETGDVIRQMPAEEALEVSRHIKAFVDSRGASMETGGQSEKALGIIMKVQA